MEHDKNKDVVNKIIDHLKSMEELPYREGAWERFRASHLKKKTSPFVYWWAASLLLVASMGGLWVLNNRDITGEQTVSTVEVPSVQQPLQTESGASSTAEPIAPEPRGVDLPLTGQLPATYVDRGQEVRNKSLLASSATETLALETHVDAQLPAIAWSPVQITPLKVDTEPKKVTSLENHILAQDHQAISFRVKEVDGQSKRFRLSDKVSMGLVFSPSATDQKMNFGGGLLMAYNITDKLSVRTGATFHQYEVGVLKDPIHSSGVEVAKSADRPLQMEASFSTTSARVGMPIIPNVNAVTGNVQTIDIPIEAKYSFYRGFYASGGVSYAAILNQKRYAHYVENVNSNPYSNGLPNSQEEQKAAVEPVTRTLESTNPNVNTSGFGGFVNMSVGKELKMKKGVSLSVEPFVKLPVGNFKRADMNYTNGGVRVITNF